MSHSRRPSVEPAQRSWQPDPSGRFGERLRLGDRWSNIVRQVQFDHLEGWDEGTEAWVQDLSGVVLHLRYDRLVVAGSAGALVEVPGEHCLRAELVEPARPGAPEVGLRLVLHVVGDPACPGREAVLTLLFAHGLLTRIQAFQAAVAERYGTVVGPACRPEAWAPPDDPRPDHGLWPAPDGQTRQPPGRHRIPDGADADRLPPRPERSARPTARDMMGAALWTLHEGTAPPEPAGTAGPPTVRAATGGRAECARTDSDVEPRSAPVATRPAGRPQPVGPPELRRLAFRGVPDTEDWVAFAPRPDSDEVRLAMGVARRAEEDRRGPDTRAQMGGGDEACQ